MRIGFVVNDVMTEEAGYTTTRLAMDCINHGHEAWTLGIGDLCYAPDEFIYGFAHSVKKKSYKSTNIYIEELQSDKAKKEKIKISDFDILMLRNDPAQDIQRPWAQSAPIMFGRRAVSHGVIVLNDPDGLARANNKMYFQGFPEEVRPKTLITRNATEIKEFSKEHQGNIVLKPLQGSGGQNVFLVKENDAANMNQMIEAVCRDGYVIAQEYLPKAEGGDVRLFVMNGAPLMYKGKYAAFRRVRQGGDVRSNVHAGGQIQQAVIDDNALELVEMVRPKLIADGMFLVGLDIVGDKLMEINVFSPGGLGSAKKFEKVNFTHAVIEAMERKVQYMQYYRRKFDNAEMATL